MWVAIIHVVTDKSIALYIAELHDLPSVCLPSYTHREILQVENYIRHREAGTASRFYETMCRGEEIENLVSSQSALLTHNKDNELLQGKRKRRGYLERLTIIVPYLYQPVISPISGFSQGSKRVSGKPLSLSRFFFMWQQGCVKPQARFDVQLYPPAYSLCLEHCV